MSSHIRRIPVNTVARYWYLYRIIVQGDLMLGGTTLNQQSKRKEVRRKRNNDCDSSKSRRRRCLRWLRKSTVMLQIENRPLIGYRD